MIKNPLTLSNSSIRDGIKGRWLLWNSGKYLERARGGSVPALLPADEPE